MYVFVVQVGLEATAFYELNFPVYEAALPYVVCAICDAASPLPISRLPLRPSLYLSRLHLHFMPEFSRADAVLSL